jgi:hypothetical protein
MERLIKKLEENNVEYKVCNKNTKHINIYFNGKVVISYYGTTGTIYSPYVEIREYQGEDMVMYLYNTIFNNKYVNDVLIKQIEGQQEQINYLRRSVERKEQSLLEEQMESLDMVNIIGQFGLYLDKKKMKSILFKWLYSDIINKLEELKERFDYYE